MRGASKVIHGVAASFALFALSAGSVSATAPALTTPYADAGCLCVAMFPGQPTVSQLPGTGREGLSNTETSVLSPSSQDLALRLTYWHMPAGTSYDLHQGMAAVTDFLASDGMDLTDVQYETFRGHPSVTGEFDDHTEWQDEQGRTGRGYAKVLIFTVDDRVFALRVATSYATRDEGIAEFNAFSDSFQFF